MNLLPTAEQHEIIASSAAFLAASRPSARVRASLTEPDPVDPEVWRSSGELGWFVLGLPEAVGGVGGSLADEALLFREIGRWLAPGPYVATVLGARVAALGGAPDLAGTIGEGTSRVGLAVLDHSLEVGAERVTGALQLIDAAGADHVLVATPERALLVALSELTDLADSVCIDEATRLSTALADGVPAVAVVPATTDPVYRRGLVLTAALSVGIAEATRDVAAEHAKSRVQFDRPIGVNQGVKHPCADMAVRAEASWSQTLVGALAHDEGRADAEAQAASAWLVATDAAERNSAAALQVLGGMGFTFEHDANLYVKRGHVLARGLTDRREQLDRLVDRA